MRLKTHFGNSNTIGKVKGLLIKENQLKILVDIKMLRKFLKQFKCMAKQMLQKFLKQFKCMAKQMLQKFLKQFKCMTKQMLWKFLKQF